MTTTTEPELFRATGTAPATPLERAVMERISTLLRYRRWWRANRWADWPVERLALDTELRALVRLARAARREEAAVPDPIDQYRGWQEAELREAFGR